MIDRMRSTDRVTITLPSNLLASLDALSHREHRNRSQTLASLLEPVLREEEHLERDRRHRAAYEAMPETDAERCWAQASEELLLRGADEEWGSDATR